VEATLYSVTEEPRSPTCRINLSPARCVHARAPGDIYFRRLLRRDDWMRPTGIFSDFGTAFPGDNRASCPGPISNRSPAFIRVIIPEVIPRKTRLSRESLLFSRVNSSAFGRNLPWTDGLIVPLFSRGSALRGTFTPPTLQPTRGAREAESSRSRRLSRRIRHLCHSRVSSRRNTRA